MSNAGSMERTLSAKSLCQWTAATTLVAVGSISFLSAHTLEKLSTRGDVAFDSQAFQKLGAVSLAVDRTEEEKLIREEGRLIEKAALAQAEALPKAAVKFAKIRLPVKKRLKVARFKAVAPTGISAEEQITLAALEKVRDPAVEAESLASVYRRVRFKFIAAADHADQRKLLAEDSGLDSERADYGDESVEIAKKTESFEFDSVPTYVAADFDLPDQGGGRQMVVETAPGPRELNAITPDLRAVVSDEISNSASATAKPEIFSEDPVPPAPATRNFQALTQGSDSQRVSLNKVIAHEDLKAIQAIASPGLDAMPDVSVVSSQPALVVNTQKESPPQATGPPEIIEPIKVAPPAALALSADQSTPSLASKSLLPSPTVEKISPEAPPTAPVTTQDVAEYSKDLSSIFGDGYGGPNEGPSDYSEINGDDNADAEYSARPTARAVLLKKEAEAAAQDETLTGAGSRIHRTVIPTATQPTKSVQLGGGVSKDSKGITISWNEKTRQAPGIEVSLPKDAMGAEGADASHAEPADDKFSFSRIPPPAALAPDLAVATETQVETKCDTEKLGVEAFNPSAEKETMSICRRPLSLEGALGEEHARWWEAYDNEAAHWPTLIYQKPKEALAERDRVPMLANASIRILSTLSRMNTHTGMGIVFGELPKGLDIRLVGRSDAPIYLDSGMKVRDVATDSTSKRQFVFLNVLPGQPLLSITDTEKKKNGAIPVVVKTGMATYVNVPEPTESDAQFIALDASSAKETRLPNLTAEIIGQKGRVGISDRKGIIKISKVVTFGAYPIYVDLIQDEKSYKNRFRLTSTQLKNHPLFFFDEKRAGRWIAQLAGGVSPYSGLIVGIIPNSAMGISVNDRNGNNQLRIGTFDKKSSLVPERYLLDANEHLVSESTVRVGMNRFIGVQVPEGVAIPSVINAKGALQWSEIVYAQPGVINVVGP